MKIPLAMAMALATSAAAAADWILECPPQLATSQALAGIVPEGWSGVARTASAVHDTKPGATVTEATPPIAIAVFDGPPSQMADLVPDNPNAELPQWTFAKNRPRDIYVVCNYADTRIALSRKAPPTVTSCALAVAAPGVICKQP